jgi:Haem-binding domain
MIKFATTALCLFAIAQLIRPAKNISPEPDPRDDMLAQLSAPPEVRSLLQTACYDCHSNNTRYPWYSNIQPTGWWLAKHVNDGKRQLNFSTFGKLNPRQARAALNSVVDEVSERRMPLKSYTWGHPDARLSDEQVARLVDWAEASVDAIPQKKTSYSQIEPRSETSSAAHPREKGLGSAD